MKNSRNFYRFIAFSLCILGATALFYKMCHSMCAIRYVTFAFDPQFSFNACEAIKKQVALAQSDEVYNPQTIVDEISYYFESVKSVTLQQLPHHTAHITIEAYEPIVRINIDQLLLENQSIINAGHYAEYKCALLYQMSVGSPVPTQVCPEIMAAIKRCVYEQLFDHYTFYITNESEWYLHDMKDPAFTLCCNALSLPIGLLHGSYDLLKKQAKKKGVQKAKWMADIRFHDQIILSMDKGGRYGKTI